MIVLLQHFYLFISRFLFGHHSMHLLIVDKFIWKDKNTHHIEVKKIIFAL
jgi:hypothetical protein